MQLTKIQTLEATLELLSGLRIGASEGEIRIGGVDNQVIRNPINNQPYIPGSSLKGKVRSLLEWRSGAVQSQPSSLKTYRDLGARHPQIKEVLQLFGMTGDTEQSEQEIREIGPGRLAFWDAPISAEWIDYLNQQNSSYVEIKTETAIDRIQGTAARGSLRTGERVPAGSRFDFRLSIKVLDIDGDGSALRRTVLAGLRLLELDSLGGSGSRGYGKIKFRGLKLDGQDIQSEFDALDPFAGNAA